MKKLTFIIAMSVMMFSSCNKDCGCIDESRINPEAICTMDYSPVCGCDGKTYSNPCVAESNGVTSYKQGECSGKK